MKKVSNFFNKLKMDAKFSRAGEGHKLTDDTRTYRPAPASQGQSNVRARPMSSSQMQAGAAAAARHEEKSRQTKNVVPKVLRAKPVITESAPSEKTSDVVPKKKTSNPSKENNIMFHSPFTDEIIPKSNLRDHMRENLILRLSESPVEASSLMIHTLNKNKDKKKAAVDTIFKYIDNIIAHPDEEKYAKIRKNNRIFSEKVAPIEGCEEFLEAVGFKRTMDGTDEVFFVLNEVDIEILTEAKETLNSAQTMEYQLFRDPKILIPHSGQSIDFKLSDQFYKLTSQEVKQEQEMRTEEVVSSKQLRTKVMRESGVCAYKYNYAIIRIKFPDERLLQGTFRANETVGDLKIFISENINVEWAVFYLKTPVGESIDNEAATLSSLSLVPSAVINLTWNEEIKSEILKEQGIDLTLRAT